MIRDFDLTREYRNQYVRRMLRLLVDKYYVSRPAIARAMGLSANYVRDFYTGHISLGDKGLDKFESFIDDLYEPIIVDEIEMNRAFVDEIIEASRLEREFEEKNNKGRKRRKRVRR